LRDQQQGALQLLAGQVMQLFELHLMKHKEAQSFAARALRESEKRFSRLFSSAAAGIALCTPNGTFFQANPAFCLIVGYSEEELRGIHFSQITHPDDLPGSAERLRKLLSGEIENFVMEKRLLRKDGETIWVHSSISCVHSDQGEPLHVIAVVEDITERVKAQTVVSRLQERLALTLEHMTDAFCLLDREWRVSFINKEGQRLVLHTAEQ
jgi:PAS domain S-box-containing protein